MCSSGGAVAPVHHRCNGPCRRVYHIHDQVDGKRRITETLYVGVRPNRQTVA
eukprot:SAG25_NODE_8596_length_414_cov_0.936508_2_plen_51_part_01